MANKAVINIRHGLRFIQNNETMFIQLSPGAWKGWLFYYKDNSWISIKEATKDDLLNILTNTTIHKFSI